MDTFADSLILVLASMLRLFSLMLVIYALLSWIVRDGHHPVFGLLQSMVEPLLVPFRKVLPPIGGFDISVVAAMIVIEAIREILLN